MMTYTKTNNLIGWTVFLLAFIVYWLTKEPTVSYWDCGEFIAAAYKLQVVHQPGAPLFLLLQNIFGNLALDNSAHIALWMNAGSALASALTILFLFWTITALSKRILANQTDHTDEATSHIKIFSAGIIGALAFTFSDSFWFSAVESEVYALSSLFTALIFWLALKWDAKADEPRSSKWLLLIAYMMGLSIGVHLLNLLTIPVIGLLVYFRMTEKTTKKGIASTLLWSVAILAFILWGVIQYLLKAAAQAELLFVNGMGLPFGSGIVAFALALLLALALGIGYTQRKGNALSNAGLLGFVFVIFGYGSFAMVAIRGASNPSLNNNAPDNIFNFIEYVTRDQYPSAPLITGPFYDSRPTNIAEGAAIYRKDADKYTLVKHKSDYVYDRTTLFPRIHDQKRADFYRSWLQIGDGQKPTFVDNIRFFISYQANVMYWRYFLWNFVGRQNDEEGHFGNYTDGNWISGIKALDNARLGGQYSLSQQMENDPTRNTYFFLPLLLGIVGLIWHYRKDKKTLSVTALFFFFTGLAIVLYLNDSPIQPRERDYVYVGSFYVFAIWIGMGTIALQELLSKRVARRYAVLATSGLLLAVPAIMAIQGWDDHDRSEKYTARDLNAHNYLASCEPNAILFTMGDNDTYPLWYAQEVEKFRTDVRIVNIGLLGADWYARQMKKKINNAEALPISMKEEQFTKGVRDYLDHYDYGIAGHIEIEKLLDVMLSNNPNDKLETRSGQLVNFLPTKKMKYTINKEEVIENKIVPQNWQHLLADTMEWEFNGDYITRAHIVLLDILAHNQWKRPIYFSKVVPPDESMGLDKYLVNEGLVSKLMPIKASTETDTPSNTEAIYSNLMEKFEYGNLKEQKYLDPLSRNMVAQLSIEMGQLSQDLLQQQDRERAKSIANKAVEVMPQNIYSLNHAVGMYFTTDTLYEVNETSKAQQLLEKNTEYVYSQLNYWIDIAATKPDYNAYEIRRGMGLLNALLETASKHKDSKMKALVEQRYKELENKLGRV